MDTPAPHLHPLRQNSLACVSFLDFTIHNAGCSQSLLFPCFPQWETKQFSLSHTPWPAFCSWSLSTSAGSHCYPEGSGSQPQRAGGMDLARGMLGVPAGQFGRSLGYVYPIAHRQASWWNPECSQQEPYPINALLKTYKHFLDLFTHGASNWIHWILWEMNGSFESLLHSWGSQAFTHWLSHHPREKPQPSHLALRCSYLGRGQADPLMHSNASTLSSLSLFVCCCCFPPLKCRNPSLGNMNFNRTLR